MNTVCEKALCPNISECFSSGVATFMILGNTCTRSCSFCGLNKGKPFKPDLQEAERIKEAVRELGLTYIVVTSPTRDDLDDYGAQIFCQVVKGIKGLNSNVGVELLIPDFLGEIELIERIGNSGADVIAHNLETIPSLYQQVRKDADYNRSLEVLRLLKRVNRYLFTKSSLMLGLGETDREVISVLEDLRKVNCDFLTLGQYLPPSLKNYHLKDYINPAQFSYFEDYALRLGFKAVKSSPYVRSSYLAHTFLKS